MITLLKYLCHHMLLVFSWKNKCATVTQALEKHNLRMTQLQK